MKYFFRIFSFFLAVSICIIPSTLWADASSSDQPIKINADDMLYDMNQSTVKFKGNVVATRGELLLTATEMIIFLENGEEQEENKSLGLGIENSEVQRIEANGSVRFQYGAQTGSAGNAVYETKKSLLTLMNDPEVRDGDNNFIRGEIIRYNIEERRSEVIGGSKGRVEAVFIGN